VSRATDTDWIVTWLGIEVQARSSGTAMMPNRKHKAFDNQKAAVSHAMSLEAHRSSIQLQMPGGQIVDFPVIEQMHAAQKLADDK
jgi:hypothetical protein